MNMCCFHVVSFDLNIDVPACNNLLTLTNCALLTVLLAPMIVMLSLRWNVHK